MTNAERWFNMSQAERDEARKKGVEPEDQISFLHVMDMAIERIKELEAKVTILGRRDKAARQLIPRDRTMDTW